MLATHAVLLSMLVCIISKCLLRQTEGSYKQLIAVLSMFVAGLRLAGTMHRSGARCSTTQDRGLLAATTPAAAPCR